ncbi:MAG: carboxymuconolactone decarboxylase family protein [Cellulomonas sp.]|jgi:alkyl hydroperoxide reductase subunit D|nr:carboxymuconolactone decarboxylase family protein [Cellulomonas sp.]
MGVETLKEALPEFAKDIKLNLGSLSRTAVLTSDQLWGTLLATAAATRNATVLREIDGEARQHLSDETRTAALGAATIMGMNNVFYRGRHFLGTYDDLPAGLRMTIIGRPGVDKSLFELWSVAVSAINGCEMCMTSHEATVRQDGLSREVVLEVLKVAAVVAGAAQALTIAEALEA